ncbi:hypothetical protein N7931_17800 [Catenovulum sp. 2E275]|uniref:hypothetical protein n=1 Tax=Catenovulum sp. 2E275 TaxID=2980497 RepID=UPI0021D21BDC|nr:hypothetical protein [Catenovulum sp. 2E275]MCU4677480.1 hypothetical protein [Catenovulum sp. 2E275]
MNDLICLQCGQLNDQNAKKCSHCKQPPLLTKAQFLCKSCKTKGFNQKQCANCKGAVQPIADIQSAKFDPQLNAKFAEQAEWLKVYYYQLISKVEIKLTIRLICLLAAVFGITWYVGGQETSQFTLFIYGYMLIAATIMFNFVLHMMFGNKLCLEKLEQLQVKAEDKQVIETDMPRELVMALLHYRLSEMATGFTRKHYQKLIPIVIEKYVEWK